MGKQKNKSKQKKEAAVFKVAGVRKPKTKTISTNLKKLTSQTKSKTEELNKKFDSQRLQESLTSAKVVKPSVKKGENQETQKSLIESPPDMDQAAEDFAKL